MAEQAELAIPDLTRPRLQHAKLRELIAAVAKRHKVLLREDDPALVLWTMFEEANAAIVDHVATMLERMQQSMTVSSFEQTAEAQKVAEALVGEAGNHVHKVLWAAAAEIPSLIAEQTRIELDDHIKAIVAEHGKAVALVSEAKAARNVALIGALAGAGSLGGLLVFLAMRAIGA